MLRYLHIIMIISNIKNNECTCMWNSSKNLQKLKQSRSMEQIFERKDENKKERVPKLKVSN